MRHDSTRRGAGAPPQRGFWGDVGYGMTLWVLRRFVFLLAAGVLGALVALVLYGAGEMATGAVAGLAIGFALLVAWFALRELV
jgi:hypothetical protein